MIEFETVSSSIYRTTMDVDDFITSLHTFNDNVINCTKVGNGAGPYTVLSQHVVAWRIVDEPPTAQDLLARVSEELGLNDQPHGFPHGIKYTSD